ncbi:hypothetical protein BHE74_00056397, partial [Ensete ventricosum]
SDIDPGLSLGIRPKNGRFGGSSSGVRYEFTEGIRKLARNMPRDCQRKTVRLTVGDSGCFRIAGVMS